MVQPALHPDTFVLKGIEMWFKKLMFRLTTGALISAVNWFGDQYVTYEMGRKLRLKIERMTLLKGYERAVKTKRLTVDDSGVQFFCGFLKSEKIHAVIAAERDPREAVRQIETILNSEE